MTEKFLNNGILMSGENIFGVLFLGLLFVVFAAVFGTIFFSVSKLFAQRAIDDFKVMKSENERLRKIKISEYEKLTSQKVTATPPKDSVFEYWGFVFHLLSSLILLPILIQSAEGSGKKIVDFMLQSTFFQFKASLMLLLIGLVNPFVQISPEKRKKILALKNDSRAGFVGKIIEFITRPYIVRTIKSFAAAYIFAGFLRKNFFEIPWESGHTIAWIYLGMIIFFILSNLYRLIFYPQEFLLYNRVRLRLIGYLIIPVAMIGLIIGAITLGLVEWTGNDIQDISAEVLFFLAYNVIMTYINWKFARL